ncbi:MAG: class II aldolase/adducin family protein [Candidatus Margulisiibacteriota bacterium]|nr:class II aldolase/adducin family protein [Candidatus Margulisiibacteriota bacterium]
MKDVFRKAAKGLFDEGLVSAFSGSLSVRDGDRIFTTSQNAMLSDLSDDDVIEVPLADNSGSGASREIIVHRAIYQNSSAKAIIQATPAFAISLSINENKILPQDAHGQTFLKSIPVVKVRDPLASQELARMLPSVFKSSYVSAVVKGYGSFVIASDLIEAYKLTSCLERSCKVLYLSKKNQPQPSRSWEDKKRHHTTGIPPGIGVMDRSRYRKR